MRDNVHMVLEGRIVLLAPLSHIGESISTDSYLNTVSIIGPDGEPEEVFIYSGNAWRGMMRDHGARYLLEKLGITGLPLETFYLLFSGGNIGGEQKIDIGQARKMRKALPLFSMFGGGVGNQILGGKLNVGAMYPVCRECDRLLPSSLKGVSASWREWITEQSYTRTDDAKDERLSDRFLRRTSAGSEQRSLMAETEEDVKAEATKSKAADKDGPAQQMRYTQELMAPGSQFYQRIDIRSVNELEIGALVSCMHEFAKHPYIGGQARIGHGLCEMSYTWRDLGDDKAEHKLFLAAGPEGVTMGEKAKESMDAYNYFLVNLYEKYLAENKQSLVSLMSGETLVSAL